MAQVAPAGKIGSTTSFDGSRIVYEWHEGEGRPVAVFVHGWCCSREFWRSQIQAVAKYMPVVALDLAGHGQSGKDGAGRGAKESSLTHFAEDVVSVVKALNLEDVILIGHSMGGGVVLEAARKLDGTVRKAVVVDTFVFDYGQFSSETVQGFIDSFTADFPGATRNLVAQTCLPGTDATFIDGIADEMVKTRKPVGLAALEGLLNWQPEPAFDAIGVSIVCINGDMINADARRRHAGRFEEIRLPGTGHFLQMEQPAEFNRHLQTVLTG